MVAPSLFIEGFSSSSPNARRYDVFLSCRGTDTRDGFANRLHKALIDANISTFFYSAIATGEALKHELEYHIKNAKASIIVLSKNYADSTICLDELVVILDQHWTANQFVIPVYYHVDPTHVRMQQSTYGDAMAMHKQKIEAETDENKRSQLAQEFERWLNALTRVTDLEGRDVNDRSETKFIEEIVKTLLTNLHMSNQEGTRVREIGGPKTNNGYQH